MARAKRSKGLEELNELTSRVDDSALVQAEKLWGLRESGEIGLTEAADTIGMSRRAAYYLVDVWDRIRDLDVPRDRLAAIGWTKLAILARHRPEKITEKDLKLAETCIVDALAAALDGSPLKSPKIHKVLLRLTATQYKRFEATLLANGAKAPKNGRGLAGKERALMKALDNSAPA